MDRFERLYRKHVNAVFGFAMRCVGRRDVAEDITSEAFLALYRHLDRIDENQLPAWLLTVTKNRAVDHWRRCEVERRYAQTSSSSELAVEPLLERTLLESAALKPIHRACLTLRYLQGMTLEEIAQQIGISKTRVKGYLQYSRTLVRKELSQKQPFQKSHAEPDR